MCKLKINCDLGEGFDEIDTLIMPWLSYANIACGGHAGDEQSMRDTIQLALREINSGRELQIGAHPSYPDKVNFGRISFSITKEILADSLIQQITHLIKIASELGVKVSYIKPHGALYNDFYTSKTAQSALLLVADFFALPLMVQALPVPVFEQFFVQEKSHLPFIYEVFIDRAYKENGFLVPRSEDGSVFYAKYEIEKRIKNLLNGGLFSQNGKWLNLSFHSACFHSDTPNSAAMIGCIK